jgi:hypothetical protein
MLERLVTFCFDAQAQGDADGVHVFQALRGFTLVGASLCAEALTGTPTAFDVDVQDDGSDVITALAAHTAGTPGTWLSTALGGSNDPVHVAADSTVEIDVNFTGGSSPTADYHVQLWATLDE